MCFAGNRLVVLRRAIYRDAKSVTVIPNARWVGVFLASRQIGQGPRENAQCYGDKALGDNFLTYVVRSCPLNFC